MSDWKESSTKRRDVRQGGGPDPRPVGGSKKDTKRWCKGKSGVEHTLVARDYTEVKHAGKFLFGARQRNIYEGWKILLCSDCGKEFETYAPMGPFPRPPPDWAK